MFETLFTRLRGDAGRTDAVVIDHVDKTPAKNLRLLGTVLRTRVSVCQFDAVLRARVRVSPSIAIDMRDAPTSSAA